MNNASANTYLLYNRPEFAEYINRAILTRSPLILAGNNRMARSILKSGCSAVHLAEFKASQDFVQSIASVARYFDGVYVLVTEQEPLSWPPYQLCRAICYGMRFDQRTYVGLSYAAGPITPSSLAVSLSGAVQVSGIYRTPADNVVNFVKTFWTELATIPDVVPLLGKLAASAKPNFSKRIVAECLAPAGLDARLFRKHRRAEKAALEYARLCQCVREGLCA
jgi:hypothetical protein